LDPLHWAWGEVEYHGSRSKWQSLLPSWQPGSKERERQKEERPKTRYIFSSSYPQWPISSNKVPLPTIYHSTKVTILWICHGINLLRKSEPSWTNQLPQTSPLNPTALVTKPSTYEPFEERNFISKHNRWYMFSCTLQIFYHEY
jgi:hypothetical protein